MLDDIAIQFSQELEHTSFLAFVLVFIGGILTSLSPCVISMLPVLIGYIGISESSKKTDALIQSSLFVIGLALVVSILGLLAALLGGVIGSHIGKIWYLIMSLAAILFGLAVMEVIHIPFPSFIKEFPKNKHGKHITPILMGLAFGLANSPCATPFLAGILTYVAYRGNIVTGAILLILYSLGQGIILMAAGMFVGFLKSLKKMQFYAPLINKASGGLLILTGFYIGYIAFF